MSVSSIAPVDPMRQLAKALMQTIDKNADSVISSEEFTSFLSRLLGADGVADLKNTSSRSDSSTTSTSTGSASAQPGRVYAAVGGYDTARLNNLSDTAPKYEFMRWMLDNGLAPTTENLQKFVDAHPDWEMQGSDQIRVKQAALDLRSPGKESVWQDAIRDVNGPEASWQFINA